MAIYRLEPKKYVYVCNVFGKKNDVDYLNKYIIYMHVNFVYLNYKGNIKDKKKFGAKFSKEVYFKYDI